MKLPRLIFCCFLFLGFFAFHQSYAQTTVTAASPLNLCVGGSVQTLSTITVAETTNAGFGTQVGGTFILTAPTDFIFVSPGSVTVTPSSGNITVNSITVGTSTISINLTVSATAATDFFTISNLQVQAVSTNASGNILRLGTVGTGGNFNVSGGQAARGSGISYASLTSVLPPTTSNAGTTLNTCSLVQTLGANVAAVGTGTWSKLTGLGTITFGNVNVNNTSATASAYGTYTLQWSIVNGTCAASTSSVTVNYYQPPSASVPGVAQTLCGNSTTLAATAPVVGTGFWTVTGGTGGSFVDATSPTTVFNGTQGTTYTLQWTISNGSCPVNSNTTTVAFDLLPTTSNAGTPLDACGLVQTLGANVATVGTGTWSKLTGPGSIVFGNVNVNNTSATASAYGTYTLQWSIVNGTCAASTSSVTVNYYQPPSASVPGVAQTLCGNSTTLAATAPVVGTGFWTVTGGTGGSFVDATSPTTVFSGTQGTAYTLQWTISNGSCPVNSNTTTVAFDLLPTTSNAGTPLDACGLVQTLGANVATVGTGTWSKLTGPGSIVFGNVNVNNTSATASAYGTYTLQWSIVNGTCAASTSSVTVNYYQPPSASVPGVAQTLCGNSTTLAATAPVVGTGFWTVTGGTGGSFVDATSPTTVFNGTQGTTYTLQWTISNGSCPVNSNTTTVAFDLLPTTSNAGTPLDACGLVQTLGANVAAVGTGTWSKLTGPGSIVFGNVNVNNTSATASAYGTYTLQWSIVNGTCAASTSSVTVNYYQPPSASVPGVAQTLCGNSTTLAATAPVVGTGFWTVTGGTGGSFVDATSPTTVFNGTQGTTYTLQWTISNGSCPVNSNTTTVAFDLLPTTSNAGTPLDACGLVQTLGANVATVGTGTWSKLTGPGSIVFGNVNVNNTSATASAYGTYTLQWSIVNGTCAASTSSVTVNYYQPPSASVPGVAQTLCGNSTTLAATAPVVGTGFWTVTGGTGGSFVDATSPTTVFNGTQGTTYTLQWTISNGSCPVNSNTTTVAFDLLPTTSNAGTPLDACGLVQTLGANVATVGTGTWSKLTGPGSIVFGNVNVNNTSATASAYGTYTLQWSIVNGTCAASTSSVTVNYYQPPSASVPGVAQTLCGNSTTLAATAPVVGTGFWTVTGGTGGSFVDATSPTTVFNGTQGTTYTLQWTISNGSCPVNSNTTTVAFDLLPTTSNAGTPLDACGLVQTLGANVATVGTGTWSKLTGPGSIVFGNVNVNNTSATASAYGTYTLQWSIVNGTCAASTSSVTVNYYQPPSASVPGVAQTLCGNSTTLAATAPVVGTGFWTVTGGTGGSFVDATSPTTVFNGTQGTTYTLQWTISNGNCPVNSNTTTVKFDPEPTVANAGPDIDQCETTNFTLAGNPALAGSGLWSNIGGFAGVTITTPASPTSTVTGLPNGQTVTLRWTITSGTCGLTSDDVTLINRALAPAANAGADMGHCNDGTFILNGNDPSITGPGTGLWTVAPIGAANITAPNAYNSTVTGVAPGTSVTLQWTITNGTCLSTNDFVILTNDAPAPAANAGPDIDQCGVGAFTMSASNPAPGTGLWTNIGGYVGVTIVAPTSPTTTITGLPAGDNVTLRWTITNGNCPTTTDDITLTNRLTAAVANAGPNQSQCNNSIFTLAGSDPTPGTGMWTVSAGTAVITNPASPTSTVTGIVAGTGATLTWTVTNGSCAPTTKDVLLTNDAPPPAADAGLDQEHCNVSTFTLSGSSPTPGTGLWSYVSGNAGVIITTPASISSTVTGLTAGTTVTLRWTVSNGSCPSVSDDVVLTNRATPTTANAGAPQSQCNNSVFTLAGNLPVVGTGLWSYQSGFAGISITVPTSNTTTVTGLPPGNSVTLQWTISNGACGSTNSTVTLINNALPPVSNAGPDQSLCVTAATLAGNGPGIGTGAWTIISGAGGSFVNAANFNTTFNGVTGTTYVLRWTITNGTCTTFDDVQIDMKLVPNVAASGQIICSGLFTNIGITNPNAVPGTTFAWTIQSSSNVTGATLGSGSVISQQLTVTDGINPGSVTYQITPTSNGCSGTPLNVTVNVNAVPTLGVNPSNTAICGGTSTNILLSNPNNITGGVTYSWTASTLSGTVTGTASGSGTPIVQTLTTDNVGGIFRYVIKATANTGSCMSATSNADITVKPVPTAAVDVTSTTALCSGATTNIILQNPNSVAGTTFTWTSSVTSGVASGNTAGSGSTILDVLTSTTGGVVQYLITPIVSGCPGTTIPWTVTISSIPVASAGAAQDQCNTSTFTLAGNNPAPGTGLWTYVSGNAGIIITTPASPTSTVTGLTAGTNVTLRWTVSNGSCASVFSDVVLTNRTSALPANAGAPQSQCNNSVFTLAGSSPSPGTGLWTYQSGFAGISITAPTASNSTVTGLTPGNSVTLLWTVSNGSCGNTNATVTLTNDAPPPVSNAGPDQSLCVTAATLAGNGPGIGTGAWTIISGAGGSFVNAANFNTTFNGVTGTTYVLRWTISNGTCTTFDDVQIDMKLVPNVAASGQIICSGLFTNIGITNPNAVPGTTFAWTIQSSSNITGATLGSGSLISQQLTVTDGINPGSVTYQITPSSNGCSGTPLNVTVNVNAVPTLGVNPSNTAICGGTSTNIVLSNPNNITGGVTYSWTASTLSGTVTGTASGSGTPIVQTLTTDNVGGIFRYVIKATANTGSCMSLSSNADITVKPVPTAAVDVTSTTAMCSGATTNILLQNPNNVVGTTFTWTSSVTSGVASGNSSGSGAHIADVLTTTSAGGVVRYTVTPAFSGCSGSAVTWDVTVNPVPASISTVRPVICSDVAFSYDPQPTNITNGVISTFTWTAVYDAGLTGGPAGGSGPVTGTLTNVTGGVLNAVFTITPKAPGPGSCNGPVFTITVPVNPKPVGVVITEPSVCSDVSFSFNPQAQVASNYTWTAAYDPGLTGGPASGSGPIVGTATNITGAPSLNIVFTVAPTSITGTCAGAPFLMTVPILIKPKGMLDTAPAICSDAAVNYNLQANVTSVNNVNSNFSWIAAANALVTGQSLTTKTGPFITDALTNISGANQTVVYTITPTGTNGCVGNSFTVNAPVKSKPVGSNNTRASVCSGTAFSYDPQVPNITNGMTSTFAWLAAYPAGLTGGTGSGSGAVAETLNNLTNAPLTAVYTVTPSSGGCLGNPYTISVPVNPQPVGVAQNITRCSNTAVNTTLATAGGSVPALSFNISVNPNGLSQVGGIPSGGSGKNSTELVDDVWKNISGLAVTVVYSITPVSAAGCAGATFNVRVAVNPEPVGVAQTIQRCSDDPVGYDLINNIALLGNNVGSTFSWVTTANAFVGGESTSPVAGPVITDTLDNVTGVDQTVIYSVSPTGVTGCTGVSFLITVTVHSEPVGANATISPICSGGNVNYNLQSDISNGMASSFTWVATPNANVGGASTSVQATTLINDILTNVTTVPQTLVYTVTPTGTAKGCTGNPFTLMIDVYPQAVISAGPNLAVCADPLTPSKQLQGLITFAPNGVVWSGGSNNFTGNGTATPNYFYTNPGEVGSTVILTLTANDPDGAGPCLLRTSTMNLKVNPLPSAVFFNLPPFAAENDPNITLSSGQAHGLFTISPGTGVGSTFVGPFGVDNAVFAPTSATLGPNVVTYTYTDANSCTNSTSQNIFINSVTAITFRLDAGNANSSGQMQLCANQGLVHITTSHGNPMIPGLTPYTRLFMTPAYTGQTPSPLILVASGVEEDGSPAMYFQTDGLVSDLYEIEYDFENSTMAKSKVSGFILVYAAPMANMDVPNHCISSAINFTDLSTVPPDTLTNAPPVPVIDRWSWNFNDGTSDVTNQNTSHLFTNPGVYNVTLTVMTNSPQNCVGKTTQVVRVGSLPDVDFKWSEICNNDSTKFKDLSNLVFPSVITNYTWKFGDGHTVSGANGASIPPGTDGGLTSGTFKNPNHKYTTNLNYTARLTIDTNDGCSSFLDQDLFILAYTTVPVTSTGNSQNFETSDGGWKVQALQTTPDTISWTWGAPTGKTINSGANGSAKAWWTGLHNPVRADSTTYYPNEQTVVNGPCFDLSQLKRPMISMDYWVDTQKDFDGAVFQYSVDGGNSWNNIGTPGQGINWYGNDQIISNPGQQTLGQYGWTGQSGKWLNARANLDTIPDSTQFAPLPKNPRRQVRVRVAFGSDATTPPNSSFDGFAFDNVFVGDKQRNVLVEHFTNSTLAVSTQADTWLNDLYQKEISLYGVSDFNDVQYHISFPTPDPLTNDNPTDPTSRGLFLGVSQPPTTIMDGLLNGAKSGVTTQITRISTDRRALKSPPFKLALNATIGSSSNKLNLDLDITADTTAFNAPLIAQVILVENSVGTFRNVVRKQLLGTVGITINSSWVANQTITKSLSDFVIDVPIVNPSQLTLIAYIEDKNTKEIYQSIAIASPAVQGSPITGLTESFTNVEEIQLFPNPASGVVNFALPDKLPDAYSWKIVDQRGIEVRTGDFSGAVNRISRAEIAGLANGMYIVIIGAPAKPSAYRKLVVLNEH